MIEQELIKIWQSSPNQERVKFDRSRLMIDVQHSINHFHRKIKYRDIREMLAVVIVSPAFVYAAFAIPYVLTKIASVLIIGLGITTVVRLRNAKKYKPNELTETYLGYLQKTRQYLLVQKKMVDSVLFWFILPCMSFVFLFLAGFIGVPGKSEAILEASIANVVVSGIVYIANRVSVYKEIIPRLEKVEELIPVMEKE